MGAQLFFKIFQTTNRNEVLNLWNAFVREDRERQRQLANTEWEEDRADLESDLQMSDTYLVEYMAYNASPYSFGDSFKLDDGYELEILSFTFKSEQDAKNWIIQNHVKWNPGMMAMCPDSTVIGGWVSV